MITGQQSTTPDRQTPFDYLLQVEAQVKMNGTTLPARHDGEGRWAGVCCELDGSRMTIALDDVAEVIEVDSLTEIPGCCHWVLGVHNLRGRLLPVFSINAFLSDSKPVSVQNPDRVIALDRGGLFCGLAVDVLYGMQKFPRQDYRQIRDDLLNEQFPQTVMPFIKGFFIRDEERWYELDIVALAERIQTANPSLCARQSQQNGVRT